MIVKKILFFLLTVFLVPNLAAAEESNYLLPIQEFNRSNSTPNSFTIDMEKYIEGITEREFKAKLIENGFVVLLNAIPASEIDAIRAVIDQTYEKATSDNSLSEAEKKAIAGSQITEVAFKKLNPGKSLFDVFNSKLKNLGNYFFSGSFRVNERTNTRRVRPPKLNHIKHSESPLGMHIDAMYHNPEEFVLNFWTPLEDCGTDKPTLRNLAMHVDDSYALMQFDRRTLSFDPLVYQQVEEGTAAFFKNLPNYYFVLNKGDIVVISNWTFHSGYANENMRHSRLSMELRISGNKFWYTK